eukprot:4191780-Karenia_brevis.AAC.1
MSTRRKSRLRSPAVNLARKIRRIKRNLKARKRGGNIPKNGNRRRRRKVVERRRNELRKVEAPHTSLSKQNKMNLKGR